MNFTSQVEPDGAQLVPVTGLNAMTTSYYLNHAPGGSANMQPRKCNCPIMCFYSTRDIKVTPLAPSEPRPWWPSKWST